MHPLAATTLALTLSLAGLAEDAEHTLSAVIGWGRYAEVFAYDSRRRLFSFDNPS